MIMSCLCHVSVGSECKICRYYMTEKEHMAGVNDCSCMVFRTTRSSNNFALLSRTQRCIVDFYICGELTCIPSVLYERERFCVQVNDGTHE
jgi:hypothetical protein